MNNRIIAFALIGSLSISLTGFAAKGASYAQKDKYAWARGVYLGGGINGDAENTLNLAGTAKVFNHYLPLTFSTTEFEQSTNNVGFDVYAGYEFNKNWSGEIGYTYVPNLNFDAQFDEDKTIDVQVRQWNIHFVAVGKLPFGRYINGFAKGGVAYFGSDQEFITLLDDTSVTDSSRTIALTYGVGIEASWDHWGLRGEYNVIRPATDVVDDFYIADVISANLYYKFK